MEIEFTEAAMGIRVRFLQLRLAPCMSVGERYEVGAGERAEGSKGTTTLSAAVQDQVSRLSPPGLRQQGDFHLGHAAREEHAEGQKMLARLDSAIASLMQHKEDQKEAQRRELIVRVRAQKPTGVLLKIAADRHNKQSKKPAPVLYLWSEWRSVCSSCSLSK